MVVGCPLSLLYKLCGPEAILLAGMTMLSNITLALALNRGGLEAVEAMMGPLSETGLAAIQGLCANPAGIYFWTGFERLVAVGLHIALSVLVYVSVRRRDNRPPSDRHKKHTARCFPAALLQERHRAGGCVQLKFRTITGALEN